MSWTDQRQGKVGDLRNQSREELQELLLRQEKILSNKRLLQTLPDKGKKIQDFADNVRLAIEQRIEEERRRDLLSATRSDLQSKYQQAFSSQQRGVTSSAPSYQNEEGEDSRGTESTPDLAPTKKNATLEKQMDTSAAEPSVKSEEIKESELVEALDRVQVSNSNTGKSKEAFNSKATTNYFLQKQTPKKPHYIAVLNRGESSSHAIRQKFKPNQLLNRSDISTSGSSSPGEPSGDASPLSAQARREQDKKHLDDVTAAKLPPLHHNPAQLLTLEESAALLVEHTRKQQELQAKLAAQKLSEGLKMSVGGYNPDGGSMGAYREVHDEEAQLSSEED
uniref:RNA polymerase II subunit M n=1 Tax=Oryzias latipes TaxID=8090 RepID=A0A3P9IYR7_ORYLA